MRIKKFNQCFHAAALAAIVLAGCVAGPKYEPPVMNIPCEWHSLLAEGTQTAPIDCFLWWEELNDPILNALIEKASLQNLDLYMAAERILEARAEKKGESLSLYPRLDGSATYGHVQYSQKTLDRILGLSKENKNQHRNVNFFEVGFDAEWELDLFGKNAHEINALKAKIEASEEEFCLLWVTLSAEIARNYIEIRGWQQQLQFIQENIDIQTEALSLTDGLTKASFTSEVDKKTFEEKLYTLIAKQPQIELAINKAIHRLSTLLGYPPGELFAELYDPLPLPSLPLCKPIGVPSDLLQRRPDIRKAERELAEATERVGSAVAEMFPRLSLQGFIGDIQALSSNSFTWFGGSQLLAPLFNSRLIEQDVEINQIKAQEALYNYQKTVLGALEEAENAIASLHYEMERKYWLKQAKAQSSEAYLLTMQLYQTGFKDYFEVITAKQSSIQEAEACLQSDLQLLFNYISLYKALGGGWEIARCSVADCPNCSAL